MQTGEGGMKRGAKIRFGLSLRKNKKWWPASFVFVSLFGFLEAFAQTTQTTKPAFLQSNEDTKEIINSQIYLAQENGEQQRIILKGKEKNFSRPKIETTRFYFTDGRGNVRKTFNVFPTSNVLGAEVYTHHSKKYLTIRRSFVDGKNEVLDGFVFDNAGKVLWHIPRKLMVGEVFPDDKTDTAMIINVWTGKFEIYNFNGVKITEKYFSDQNDQKYPDLKTPDEDTVIWGGCLSSENGEYIAVSRQTNDVVGFASELTLLDSTGNIIFQNGAPQSKVGKPLKVLGKQKVLVVLGDINGRLTNRHYQSHDMYFGLNFSGKEIWQMDGQEYFLQPADLINDVANIGRVKKTLDKKGNTFFEFDETPSGKTLNLITGEIK